MIVDLLPIAIPIGVVLVVVLFILVRSMRTERTDSNGKKRYTGKDRKSILRDANRRLASNPKDSEALSALADIYFQDNDWEKAVKAYETLVDMVPTNPEIDEYEVSLRHALSCMQLKRHDEAYKSFLIARSIKPEGFEVNYNLGYLEHLRGAYDKSAALLSHARKLQPEHPVVLRYLGLSLFKIKKLKEATAFLRKSLDLSPDDKETLFTLGQAYHELGQNDQAIKIFSHLRPDPQMGPSAALFSGTINMNLHQYSKAVMDFEIGLRHEGMRSEVRVELQYRAAMAYLKQQEIGPALKYLTQIDQKFPGYRDVPTLIRKYSELNSNRNLQIFLMSPASDFVTLCRKLSLTFFPGAKVKISDVSVFKTEYADILAEVSTKKWEDLVLFRYVRTTGVVGDVMLRDLYGKIKELKAGRGFCLSAGTFSEGAQQFVEARLIDLLDKEKLNTKLREVGR